MTTTRGLQHGHVSFARRPPCEHEHRTRVYDGRDLPWQETTGSDVGSGTTLFDNRKRTTVSEFDPGGNLRRVVNPAGVDSGGRPFQPDTALTVSSTDSTAHRGDGGLRLATKNATVNEYSPDNILTAVHMPWDDQDRHETDQAGDEDQRRFRQNFLLDARGRVKAIDAPYEWTKTAGERGERCEQYKSADNPGCTAQTRYTHYDTGWIKSSADPVAGDPGDRTKRTAGERLHYGYDKQGNQISWRSDQDEDATGYRRLVTRSFFPSGLLSSRTGKQGPGDPTPRSYRYEYSPTRQMTRMEDDRPSGQEDRVTFFRYDLADRERVTNETFAKGKDTILSYDRNGQVIRRRTDGRLVEASDLDSYSSDGKTAAFEYDPLGRETKATITRAGGTSRVTETGYFPSGEKSERSKPRGTERFFYYDDGRMSRMERFASGAQDPHKDQHYTYDRNGNRTRDERGTHVFNARSHLTAWTRAAGTYAAGSTVRYSMNGSGAVEKKSDGAPADKGGGTTTYHYLGDRLEKTVFDPTAEGAQNSTATYSYTPFDSVRSIEQQGLGTTTYAYDEFERMVKAKGPAEPMAASYDYDGLDRRDSKCTGTEQADCGGGTKLDYSYVGTSENLSQEKPATGSAKTRSYDYDSGFDRLGVETPGNATPYRSYAKDANGSVEGLETESGGKPTDKERYEYDPFGELQKRTDQPEDDPQTTDKREDDPETELTDDAKSNPFRFQGHYYDSGVKTYDMQARAYQPEVGRFLTQDRFESASGDFNLQSDSLTQNRYAFAGGNPVNNIEFDGHEPISSYQNPCDNTYGSASRCRQASKPQQKASRRNQRRHSYAYSNNWRVGRQSDATSDKIDAIRHAVVNNPPDKKATSRPTQGPSSDSERGGAHGRAPCPSGVHCDTERSPVKDPLGDAAEWAWDHKVQLTAGVAFAVCTASTAGVGVGACGYAATAATAAGTAQAGENYLKTGSEKGLARDLAVEVGVSALGPVGQSGRTLLGPGARVGSGAAPGGGLRAGPDSARRQQQVIDQIPSAAGRAAYGAQRYAAYLAASLASQQIAPLQPITSLPGPQGQAQSNPGTRASPSGDTSSLP